MKLRNFILIATVSLFINTGSDAAEDAKIRIFNFKIPCMPSTGFLREQETEITIQWPLGGGKNGEKHNLPDPEFSGLQFWLLKADGTALRQTGKPTQISIGSIGDYSTDYVIYSFAKVPTNEIAGLVMSLNNKWYFENLGDRKPKYQTEVHQPPLTAEQTTKIADICKALESADSVTIYSLNSFNKPKDENVGFHGFRIDGSLVIKDTSKQQAVAKILRHDLGNDDENGVLCFDPYHGLRIVAGSVTYDLVISSECGHVHIYAAGGKTARLSITSGEAADLLDSILERANIPHLARPH